MSGETNPSDVPPEIEPTSSESPPPQVAEPEQRPPETRSESAKATTPSYEPTPEEGVALRSRPPIFFFWPTLMLALLFTPFMGWQEEAVSPPSASAAPDAAPPAPSANDQQADSNGSGQVQRDPAQSESTPPSEATDPSEAQQTDDGAGDLPLWARRLPRTLSLALLLFFAVVMALHFAIHLFFFHRRPGMVNALHQLTGKPILWRFSVIDIFFALIAIFLLLHPAYGLLSLMAFYAFGMMTEHRLFTQVERLRSGMVWVIGAIIVAVVLEVLRGAGADVIWQPPAGAGGGMAAFFFAFLAFNMFVLAFDFNGYALMALVFIVLGVAAVVVMCNMLITPKVFEFFVGLLGGLKHLQINSVFYQAWAFVLATLMVFSGFIAKADFWQISPMAIVHHQGIIVQRTRHYGALANFHYYVEYPDFFESYLGGWSGTFILTLPREERPEVIENVWFSRHYNRQIQYLLAELPTAEALAGR